tara:strand:+ start:922 stop:1116 length:195 start_codon:yes stop_codon:yes gene_type:complete
MPKISVGYRTKNKDFDIIASVSGDETADDFHDEVSRAIAFLKDIQKKAGLSAKMRALIAEAKND